MTIKEASEMALSIRAKATQAFQTLAGIIDSTDTTPKAKIYAAHATTHLAHATADLTRLRRELAHPGGKP